MKFPALPSDNALRRKLLAYLDLRLPKLNPKSRYSLEAILGSDNWKDIDESHHAMGRAFSDLVDRGRVPFVHAGLTSDRHNRYKYTG